jgi:hypothetical protein
MAGRPALDGLVKENSAMVVRRRPPLLTRPDHEKLLQRIARRYQQLEQKLEQLETRLPKVPGEAATVAAPRKPR